MWTASKCCAVRKARCSAAMLSAEPSACFRRSRKGDNCGYVEITGR